MGKLDGKVAIITGASSGLGKQMAKRFVQEGAKIAICARTESKLAATAKECEELGGEVLYMAMDICNYADLEKLVQATVEKFGTIDVLVNNAVSICSPHSFLEHTTAELDSTIQSGLYATWNLMRLCYPYLKDKNSSIINFNSGAGDLGLEGYAAYASTKAAIGALTRVAAREWGQFGIRVNTVAPSAVTDNVQASMDYLSDEMKSYGMASLATNPMKRAGDPYEDITPAIVFLASEDSKWITGQELKVEGGGNIHA